MVTRLLILFLLAQTSSVWSQVPTGFGIKKPSPRAAFVHMGETTGGGAGTTVQTGAFTTGSTSATTGNLIVCAITFDAVTAQVASLVDTTGSNTYTQASYGNMLYDNAGWGSEIWYAKNITGGTNFKVTATLSTSGLTRIIHCSEYSGMLNAVVDKKGSQEFDNVTSATTTSFTTTYDYELIFVKGACTSGAGSSGGFTLRSNLGGDVIEDKIVSAAGPYTAAIVTGGGTMDCHINYATFRSL